MKIDDYTTITHKKYSSKNSNTSKIKYLKFLISRILISIILIISIGIFIKIDDNNSSLIQKYLFEDNIKFTKINKWYQNTFGSIIPTVENPAEMVFESDIKSGEYEEYQDGVKITHKKGSPVSLLYGGIVVFIGPLDNYGNAVIIQGNDGIDYTYGNLSNVSINLYDYIEKDTIIGESAEDYFYLVLQKDGKYLKYEEYLNESSN